MTEFCDVTDVTREEKTFDVDEDWEATLFPMGFRAQIYINTFNCKTSQQRRHICSPK